MGRAIDWHSRLARAGTRLLLVSSWRYTAIYTCTRITLLQILKKIIYTSSPKNKWTSHSVRTRNIWIPDVPPVQHLNVDLLPNHPLFCPRCSALEYLANHQLLNTVVLFHSFSQLGPKPSSVSAVPHLCHRLGRTFGRGLLSPWSYTNLKDVHFVAK